MVPLAAEWTKPDRMAHLAATRAQLGAPMDNSTAFPVLTWQSRHRVVDLREAAYIDACLYALNCPPEFRRRVYASAVLNDRGGSLAPAKLLHWHRRGPRHLFVNGFLYTQLYVKLHDERGHELAALGAFGRVWFLD